MNRANLIGYAKASIDKGSKSFALASKMFDRRIRQRVWLLYAWCRECDDLVDGQDHGSTMSPICNAEKKIAAIYMLTSRAMGGEQTGKPAFNAMGLVASECGVPLTLANDVIDGFAMDAKEWRPETEDDLYQYCYHVAGAVGCIMAIVMGVAPSNRETLDYACDLGITFQLANISRDIAEDAAAGRCYLPLAWLKEKGVDADDVMAPQYRNGLIDLMIRLCDRAEEYEKSARSGIACLPFRSRWAVLAAAGIYGDIAKTVKRGNGKSLERRVFIGRFAKIKWLLRAFGQTFQSHKPAPRNHLWTRKI